MHFQVLPQQTRVLGVRLRRSIRFLVAIASAVALLIVLAASSVSAAETKTFIGEKICKVPAVKVAPPNAGGYCLITQANIKILVGAKDYYTNAHITPTLVGGVLVNVLTSPVLIRATDRRGSTASGHCTYYYPTATSLGHGLCIYSSGTGKLAGFHARLVIGSPTSAGVTVIGPYWFDRDHHGDDENEGAMDSDT
jgi:hypothetical protein